MQPPDGPWQFSDIFVEELANARRPPEKPGEAPPPLSALCISGGGIRSATFGLGVLQGLAKHGLLEEFDYLSTVSGGGYIGAWLTSWKNRAGGLHNILPKLCPATPPQEGEVDPIGHLREYNNYLSPKLGFFSPDTWTLATTIILNMALNWLVLVPLLMFALMLPRLILAIGLLQYIHPELVPAVLKYVLRILSGLFFATAIFNTMRYLPSVGGKQHTETDFLKYCLAPMMLAVLGFMTYDAWFDDPFVPNDPATPTYWEILLWITLSFAAGWLAYLAVCVRGVRARFRLLLGPLSLAMLLTSFSTAAGAWLLVTGSYLRVAWSAYTATGPPLLLLSFLAAGGIFVGLTSRTLGDQDREWLARSAAWMLLIVVCWVGICGLALIAPRWLFSLGGWAQSGIAAAGGLAGWICSIAGFRSKAVAGKQLSEAQDGLKGLAIEAVAKLAAPVFIAILLAGLAILTNRLLSGFVLVEWWSHENFLELTAAEVILLAALAFFAIGWVAARYININKFSLHGMYRNRLIRAYLGASNLHPNFDQFPGFTESDNIRMADLKPELRPFHVVNITLNLVSGKRLAWQQRKAESFTVTALHSGSEAVGYRPSKEYGGPITLGGAVAISGAAASPNMGYHSAGAIGFIMTLFNARLGAWLGNPSKAGEKTWRLNGPSSAVASLVKEAFGLTNDTSAYVYLSDGGHFENLGLYEMVRRRCKQIVVLDSGCDPKFSYEDLGNAMRKIRIDMGITIDFEDTKPMVDQQKRCALARIHYSPHEPLDDGVLVYIKPMTIGNEPPDILTYRSSHKDFPHQSTGNQWYDESQTESYRMLGLQSITDICEGWDGKAGLTGMFKHVRDYYLGGPKAVRAAGTQ